MSSSLSTKKIQQEPKQEERKLSHNNNKQLSTSSSNCRRPQQQPPPPPTNPLVNIMLTDLYQITMCYTYWKNNRHNEYAIYELFHRKHPFHGYYTIFAGLDECLKYIHSTNFQFTNDDISYLRTAVSSLQYCDDAFFDDYLVNINTKGIKISSVLDGTIVYPNIPMMIIEGPLGICQLLETTLLTLINFPSLITTCATRYVFAANDFQYYHNNNKKMMRTNEEEDDDDEIKEKEDEEEEEEEERSNNNNNNKKNKNKNMIRCIEFGLRRSQGPDGGISASKYAIMGGFYATSNVQSAKLFHLHCSGTMAHAFIQSYTSLQQVQHCKLSISNDNNNNEKSSILLLPAVLEYRKQLSTQISHDYMVTNDSELASFIAYACSFPNQFLCLIDTYNTLRSGVLNFILVALVLDDIYNTMKKKNDNPKQQQNKDNDNGTNNDTTNDKDTANDMIRPPIGIRLDSGDLAYLSNEVRSIFHDVGKKLHRPFFDNLQIVVSNDINEDTIIQLNKIGHSIDIYGIGTHLVTCQSQPALGCVYKLVCVNNIPRMKLSQESQKITIPGKKRIFRFYIDVDVDIDSDVEDNDDEESNKKKKNDNDNEKQQQRPITTTTTTKKKIRRRQPVMDYMILDTTHNSSDHHHDDDIDDNDNDNDPIPVVGQRILCRDPFHLHDKIYITPTHVIELLSTVFCNNNNNDNNDQQQQEQKNENNSNDNNNNATATATAVVPNRTLYEARDAIQEQINELPKHMIRDRSCNTKNNNSNSNDVAGNSSNSNSTSQQQRRQQQPYRVCVSEKLYHYFHHIWDQEATPSMEL